jgi:predicted O-linked N-acetylglucosamine transferase (SPINDLY family)
MQSGLDLETALQHHYGGRYDAAESIYLRLLQIDPRNAEVVHLLGLVKYQMGRRDEAIELLRRAISLDGSVPHFHSNLASVLGKSGRPEEAVACLREAIRLKPDFAEAHNNLGVALEAFGRLDDAVVAHGEALRLRPGYAECHNNLANVLLKRGPVSAAVAEYQRAIALKADYPEAYCNLAGAYCELGEVDRAIACQRRVIEMRPNWPNPHSDLLFTLHYDAACTPEVLYAEHVRWAERHAKPLYAEIQLHRNDRAPDRRIRIGYLSPNFRNHPVTRFLEPILQSYDASAFEIFCYSDVAEPDAVTQRLRAGAHVWRDVLGLRDNDLAELIRKDGIDILVDLTGHMAAHRLLVFARKPAPVQVTYLGYPDTTGLATIDYRITDSIHDPPGLTDRYHMERLLRLDPCCWCFQPDELGMEVGPLPSLSAGRVTFAALNRLAKSTPQMMATWATILRSIPGSMLKVLVGPQSTGDTQLYDLFERHGLPKDRLVLVGRCNRKQYLEQFRSTDIALDTYPYNGHTTTCDALWMGVPVVSLAGSTHVSRAGLSVLSTVGLEDLVATTPDAYVDRAISLTKDLSSLARLRSSLRRRMQSSPLLDAAGLTARLERAFRDMWKTWYTGAGIPRNRSRL